MKISLKTILIALPIIISITYIFGGFFLSFYVHSSHKRHAAIQGIGLALKIYAHDHEFLPPLDKWCDKLISEVDLSVKYFNGGNNFEKDVCFYALNENLSGLRFYGLDEKVVLVFESKGPWNLSGGPELMKNSEKRKTAVVFVDATVQYVTSQEIDSLKWKP